jgi:hypothetical protein
LRVINDDAKSTHEIFGLADFWGNSDAIYQAALGHGEKMHTLSLRR